MGMKGFLGAIFVGISGVGSGVAGVGFVVFVMVGLGGADFGTSVFHSPAWASASIFSSGVKVSQSSAFWAGVNSPHLRF
jgi:hypothetical protein